VQLVTSKRTAVAVALSAGLALAACGAGGASHVVRAPASGVAGAALPAASPSTTSPSVVGAAPAAPINSQTLSQVNADLGAVDSALDQANADIDNPQGDS